MAGELDIIPDNSGSEQIDQLHRSQEFAATRSPEDAAGTFNYAKAAGLSFEAAEQQKQVRPLPAPSWGALVKDHPVLSRYLSEPGFAAAAQDDVHNLSAFEKLFRGWDEMLWKSKQALGDDARNQELAAIGRDQRAGTATKEQLSRADELEKEAQEPSPDIGFVPGIVPAVIGGLPGIARALPTAATYGAGGVLFGTYLTKNPRAGLAAGGAMAGAGFVAGMAMDTARTEQGLSYREYLKMGADPGVAGVASDLVALANGGLQSIPAEKVLNVVPGLRAVLQGAGTRDIMRRLIGSNTGRAVLARFAGRVAESGLLMALIGSGQELVKEAGGVAATSGDLLPSELGGTVQDWNPEDGDRSGGTGEGFSGSRILHAGIGGLQQGTGFGLAHGALPALAEKREAELGEARTTMFKSIAGIATDSKLRERMPAEFKAFANDVINEHGKVSEVKVPAEALSNLFQKEGIDPTTIQEQMPEIAKQLRDAKPGDEVVVPTADLATNIAHLKGFPSLLPDMRIGDELTPRESKEVQKQAEEIAKEKPKAEEEPAATPERKVYDDVYQKLVDAGQDPGVAQHDAALWSAFAKSRGERTGVDPFDYYQKRALSIGAEMGDVSLDQPAYHGSPYKFTKFTLDHIGSGEGAQVYGHGLYFAEEESVADYYRGKLSGNAEIKDTSKIPEWKLRSVQEYLDRAVQSGVTDPEDVISTAIRDAQGVYDNGKRQGVEFFDTKSAIEQLKAMKPEEISVNKGAKYEVDLPEKSELLDYDKPLDRQPASVLKKLEEAGIIPKGSPEAMKEYNRLGREMDKRAAKLSDESEVEGSAKYNVPLSKLMEADPEYNKLSDERRSIGEKGNLLNGMPMLNGERISWSVNGAGETLYRTLSEALKSDREASRKLLEAGIPGLKYLDQNSRVRGGEVSFYGKGFSRDEESVIVNKVQEGIASGLPIEDAVRQMKDFYEEVRDKVAAFPDKWLKENDRRNKTDQAYEDAILRAQEAAKEYEAVKKIEPEDFEVSEGTHNFVIWDENAIKILNVLEQKVAGGGDYRGKISFDNARSYFRITLTGKANLSTFLHESGHAFFEFMRKDAESGHAESVADFEKLREWLGTKPGEAPSVDQLEAFARGFEGYLLEGKAPAAGLRETFRAFSAWLKLVYRSIANLGVNLTDDVRGVMDRMLATDKEIEEAQKNIGFEPMKKPKEMTPAEYDAYKERFSKAMQASKDALEAHALKEYGQMLGAHRDAVRSDVEEASKLDPVHNAYEALRNGKRLDGTEVPEEIAGKKLDRTAVEAAGHKGIKWMQITSKEGGLDPEVAAPYYGFKNSTEMLDKLEARRPRAKEIKEETDRRMAEMYPNADIAKMADQAMKAVHTNEVGNVLWSEAQAVDKQTGGKGEIRTARAVVKEVAKRRVSEMTMIEMQPGRFARAEERVAKEWAEAYKKEDFKAAHTAKLDQIMAHEMWKATTDAKDEVSSIRDYLSKFNDLSVRRRMGKAGQNYINAIDKILEDVDLKKVTNKELGRRASLDSYLREMEEEGGTVTIPNELRSEAGLKNFKQMTLEDLRAVHDAVANIESMARLKNFLFDGRERRNFQETATKAGAHIAANLGTPYAEKPGAPQNPGWWDKKKAWLRESRAEKKKIEFIARELDGGQTAGLLHELLFQPFATAAGKAHEWGEKVTEALLKPLKEMTFKERLELDRTVDFLGTPMKLRDVIAVALNMGNDGNKRKLLEGYAYRHWTEENVTQRLGELLTDKHLDLVQHIWNTINTLWPEIKALSERTTGVAPPKVEAAKLTIRGRELEGGYYPIVYDRERSYKAEQLAQRKGDLFENNFLKPGVSKGFTEARTRFAAPLTLSMNVIPAHINEVIHYLTHYEPVRAVDRLVAHPAMRQAITEGLGRETYNLFRPWLQAIAHDGVVPGNLTGLDNILRHLRVGAAVTRLGFRLTNSIMQGFNLLSSIKELGGAIEGPKYLGLGIKRWMEDVESFRDPFASAYDKSAELKGKSKNIEHELINNFDHYTSAFSEFGAMKDRLGHFAMSFMTLAWRTCDTITWYAAREKAFDEGHTRPEEYADSVVRLSQMGEGIKDKAAIMRGGEGTKIFTNMYAWYSTIYNQLTETQPQNRSNWKKAGELASRYWWMTLAPAVLMGIARGKGPKHDKDETSSWLKYYGEEVALEIAKPWPVAGVVAETMLSEHEARFGPWISTVLRGMKARGKMIQGETLSEHEKQDIVQSTGITSHLPATALWNAYRYVSAVQDGKLEEPVRDMLLRAPGEWK